MKLLHLYHDIMNLYGDYANISALERIFKNSGVEYTADKLSFSDSPAFEEYDFIYIGSGTERNRNVVLEDIRKYADGLKAFIDSGKPVLMTGNSFEMLGKTITGANGKTIDGLGIFDFAVTEQNRTRTTGDAIFTAGFLDKPLVGFINKCSEIEGISEPLFSVKMGLGNKNDGDTEGIRKNNFFGTHLTGPVLIKNPHFLVYLARLIAGENTEIKTDRLKYENAGYEITLSELTKRMNSESH